MADTNQVVAEWRQKHGDVQGQPFPVDPTIKTTTTDRLGNPVTTDGPNPDPVYRYTFADGSTLDITGQSGQIKDAKEATPRNQPNQTINDPRTGEPLAVTTSSGSTVSLPKPASTQEEHQIIEVGGRKVDYYPNRPVGQRYIDLGPANAPTANNQPPSDPSKWQQIKAPDGRVIAMQDPVTGDRVAVPAEPGDKNSPAGTTKDTFDSGRQITWVADGNGNWSIKTIGQPLADPNKPKDGDTRPNVANGYEIREVYRGGQWVTDPSVAPKPYDPNLSTKAKEGDKRPNVVQGQQVQQIYRGGEWVIDTNVQPVPFGPQTDPNQEVRRLQALAQAERDRINQLPISDDEKHKQFDEWWQTNVEPQKATLQAAQTRQLQQDSIAAQTAQQSQINAETTYEHNRRDEAATAGRDAVTRTTATFPYRVGPQFGEHFAQGLKTLSSGGGEVNFSPSDFMFDMPDLNKISEDATARALAHISPYAAVKAGAPMPQIPPGADYNTALASSRYQFGGGQPQSTPTTTIAPDGTVTITHGVGNAPISGPQATDDPYGNLNARI